MTKKSHRIVFTLSAFFLALVIILLLSFAGNQSKGPLENFFSGIGDFVTNLENHFILQKRTNQRLEHLAWFRNMSSSPAELRRPGCMLLGAYDNQTKDSFESIIALEDSLKTTFPLVHIFTAWGNKPGEEFPKLQVKAILGMGALPVITWEPWLSDFDGNAHPHLREPELRDKGGMADIARGVYDFYIIRWAKDARDIGKPLFVRPGHEMNDPYRYPWGPQNNKPDEFIAAWRHICNVFKANGANNVIWIWSPHPAYGYFDYFYPGDQFVDYIGSTALNYGSVAYWSKWWTFQEIFGQHYGELSKYRKPIMITELGCLTVGGNRSIWFKEALSDLPVKYPLVKSVLFFHFSDDRTTTQQSLNWYIKWDTATTQAIIREIQKWPAPAGMRK